MDVSAPWQSLSLLKLTDKINHLIHIFQCFENFIVSLAERFYGMSLCVSNTTNVI